MDKISSAVKSSLYSAGYVSKSDAAAQTRCFDFLEQSLTSIQKEIDAGGANNSHQARALPEDDVIGMLKNEKLILQSAHDLMKPFAGSFALKKAEKFWELWDGSKKVAYEMFEGRDKSAQEYQDRIESLEHGRYLN